MASSIVNTTASNNSTAPNNTTGNGDSEDLVKEILEQISQYLLLVILIVIMFALGCTIKFKELKQQLRRPIGIIIGMLCQFILYPAMTFGLAHALQMDTWNALGMMLLGTCPGGSLSNVITFWSNGDVTLSVSMTACSTVIGLGMMPLNLWIYTRSWSSQTAVVPFTNIAIALVSIVVPVFFGMLMLAKFPKVCDKIVKIGSIIGFTVIMISIVIDAYLYHEIYITTWKVWIAALGLPVFGLIIGYTITSIARLPHSKRRAVAIEVSSQNVALCLTLIFVSYDSEDQGRALVFPSIYGVFVVVELLLFSFFCRLCDKYSVCQDVQTDDDDVTDTPASISVKKKETETRDLSDNAFDNIAATAMESRL